MTTFGEGFTLLGTPHPRWPSWIAKMAPHFHFTVPFSALLDEISGWGSKEGETFPKKCIFGHKNALCQPVSRTFFPLPVRAAVIAELGMYLAPRSRRFNIAVWKLSPKDLKF